jgi:hypothetical protein
MSGLSGLLNHLCERSVAGFFVVDFVAMVSALCVDACGVEESVPAHRSGDGMVLMFIGGLQQCGDCTSRRTLATVVLEVPAAGSAPHRESFRGASRTPGRDYTRNYRVPPAAVG